MIEVYADMSNAGWVGEAILRIGPRKVVLYRTEDQYEQSFEAEQAAADRVIERMGRLMTDPPAKPAATGAPKRLTKSAKDITADLANARGARGRTG